MKFFSKLNRVSLVCAVATVFYSQFSFAFKNGRSITELPAGFVRYKIVGAHCSGTLIAQRVILTAAHCVTELEKGDLLEIISHKSKFSKLSMPAMDLYYELLDEQVEINSKNLKAKGLSNNDINVILDEEGLYNTIESVHVEQDYSEVETSLSKDVAVIVLKNKITNVQTAKLDLDYVPKKGTKYRMVGHDKDAKAQNTSVGKYMDYSKNYKEEYNENFEYSSIFEGYLFPTKQSKGRVTEGDSGGPLYRFNSKTKKFDTVIGVTSSITKKLGVFHSSSIFTPIHKASEGGKWLSNLLNQIKLNAEI